MRGYDEVGTDPRRRAMIQDLKHVVTAIQAHTVYVTGWPEWCSNESRHLEDYEWSVLPKARYVLWENTLRTGRLRRVEVYVVLGDRTVHRASDWSSDNMWDRIQEEKRYEDIGGQAS